MSTEKSESTIGRDAVNELRELAEVRRKSLASIKGRLSSSKILGDADIKVYEEAMSDERLASVGKIRHQDKVQYIREDIEKSMVQRLLSDAEKLERQFREGIKMASGKWISEAKANWWIGKLENKSIPFHKKHLFIMKQINKTEGEEFTDEKAFTAFLNNWRFVAEKAEKLRGHPQMKYLTSADVPELTTFQNVGQFLALSYKKRKALVKTVDAALTAKEMQIPQLYTKAKTMLNWAVQRQALSPSKVGSWLERIFKSEAKAEEIDQFLNNKGSMPLQSLIDNWAKASKHYQVIEAKRKALGSPRGFHFVKMDVFLNWGYDQRTSYLNEADNRFTDIRDESYVFLKIRHELGAKDWDAADELIDSVKSELNDGSLLMSEENRNKLSVMEKFLREHRTDTKEKKSQEKPSPDDVIAEMHELLDQLPDQLKRTYKKALGKGYQAFWALTTLMYNRVWCHQHNFLDVGREKTLEKDAKEKTIERVDQGHNKNIVEANYVKGSTNTRPAIRNQAGVRKAQILFTEERSDETIVEEINAQKNDRNFWYWTSMIPQGVEYAAHLNIVQTLHPRMKKLARQMEQMGVRLEGTSPVKPDHIVMAKG